MIGFLVFLLPLTSAISKGKIGSLANFHPGPKFVSNKYRPIDGSGNNLKKPAYGKAFTPKIRIIDTLEGKGSLMGGISIISRDDICKCAKASSISKMCVTLFRTACGLVETLPFCKKVGPTASPPDIKNIHKGFKRWCKRPRELTGFGLPSARILSNAVFEQPEGTPQSQYKQSSWVWAWGQFLDHDVAAETDLGNDEKQTHCKLSEHAAAEAAYPSLTPKQKLSSCFQPIDICCTGLDPSDPRNDQFFTPGGQMRFFRSPWKFDKKNRRCYLNIITHWVDGSNVYGSTVDRLNSLRDLSPTGRGRLLTDASKLFAPIITNSDGRQFLFGDIRGNENPILASIHTLFVREHNRVADLIWAKMKKSSGTCDATCNEVIFEKARAYVVALIQKITYEDWLPALLGPEFVRKFVGPWKGYKSKVDPSLTMSFSVAAFRVGHTMVNERLSRVDEAFNEVKAPLELKDTFFSDADSFAADPNELKSLLLGLGAQLSEETDDKVIDGLRHMLFGNPLMGEEAFDLAARNIQRGRDNALPRFNAIRDAIFKGKTYLPGGYCKPLKKWDQLVKDATMRKKLRDELYHSLTLNNVELFVGSLIEPHFRTPGGDARMGCTFAFLIAEQFKRLRDADRFWYENYLSPQLIREVKKDNMAKLLERNLGVKLRVKSRDMFHGQPTNPCAGVQCRQGFKCKVGLNGKPTCQKKCGVNEVFSLCTTCPKTCARRNPICVQVCRPGCKCKNGFIKNAQNKCIKPSNCPSSALSQTVPKQGLALGGGLVLLGAVALFVRYKRQETGENYALL